MTILIPMAGLATRFVHEGILTPKPLIKAAGKTLIEHTIETLGLKGRYVFVTRVYDDPEDNAALSAMLTRLCPGHREFRIATPTRGAVETCLRAWEAGALEASDPLIITNCDQRTEWDAQRFLRYIDSVPADGVVVTHESSDPKHSYAATDEMGRVFAIKEKQVISKDALVGIHYWRRASLFAESARALLADIAAGAAREYYVSETYNHLIGKGLAVTAFRVGHNEYIPLGTPYDVAIYEAKVKEFVTDKPRTLFIDLDGTILNHVHQFSTIGLTAPQLLPGVLAKLNEWDSHGHRIVLCTARKESARAMTERHLAELGLCWDQLIMGLTSGPRILINDKLTDAAPDRAVAINLTTNRGFTDVDWGKVGL